MPRLQPRTFTPAHLQAMVGSVGIKVPNKPELIDTELATVYKIITSIKEHPYGPHSLGLVGASSGVLSMAQWFGPLAGICTETFSDIFSSNFEYLNQALSSVQSGGGSNGPNSIHAIEGIFEKAISQYGDYSTFIKRAYDDTLLDLRTVLTKSDFADDG